MPTYEGLRTRVLKQLRLRLAPLRSRQLTCRRFTILSNNCWGGMIYESYALQKQSPTVGLFFMAEDYIRFLTRLDEYLRAPLTFIPPETSRWKDAPQVSGDKRFGSYPIGVLRLGDEQVEIFFLHYHSEREAREKWTRRCQRVDRAHLLVKFNDQNGFQPCHGDAFAALPYPHKLFFTCRDWKNAPQWRKAIGEGYCRVTQRPAGEFIRSSFEPFGRSKYIDITRIINSL